MNKQQLANKIWESANKMRSKIEANEYKDYILGFIFYKFLSEKEVRWLKANDFEEDDIKDLHEDDPDTVAYVQNNIGYFIAYENLYSTWLTMGKDFDVSNVTDALSAFNRLISPTHKGVFEGIFRTLEVGLTKLGESSGARTKAISDLLQLIKDIPMDGKQDYDVLGFIYEYLIGQFAANAGKKAGEFYTPYEVSQLIAEACTYYLGGRKQIKIYDSTSGSGSLLLNIGRSASKYMDKNNIKYYAQELKENTYNLTRMNLVMRGIHPSNIVVRNGDTLEEDWPLFDNNDPVNTYSRVQVDCSVSNPPYSQHWDNTGKEHDPRYDRYGLAPSSKADYAFLLHDLYHVKNDGIMAIVLPHGVLFRGGDEGEIRKNLIENNNIDAIVGLPANIFYGTGIPTIVMFLRPVRENTDVLIIDASKHFIKEGKNNKLQQSDIKRIVDAIINRTDVDKFCRVVSREEIRENDYNLNIPRYVDSSEPAESWDIYSSMFGGVPKTELEQFNAFWTAFPTLKKALFVENGTTSVDVQVENIRETIANHPEVLAFQKSYADAFNGFDSSLYHRLVDNMADINVAQEEDNICDDIIKRLKGIPLIDKYAAYQLLDDSWTGIASDLEVIQSEGFGSTKIVDPHMVLKKIKGKEEEVQEGWVGRIIPFDLVQKSLLHQEYTDLQEKENQLTEISAEYDEMIDALEEDAKQELLNDNNDAFATKAVNEAVQNILADVSTPETDVLQEYIKLSKKKERLAFIEGHPEIHWNEMAANKDGTYGKCVEGYILQLKSQIEFPEGSYEAIVIKAQKMIATEKELKAAVKKETAALEMKTKETIEALSDDEVRRLLKVKWIDNIIENMHQLPETIINRFIGQIEDLASKYNETLGEIENGIADTEANLRDLIKDLEGSEFDMKGLSEFSNLLNGN